MKVFSWLSVWAACALSVCAPSASAVSYHIYQFVALSGDSASGSVRVPELSFAAGTMAMDMLDHTFAFSTPALPGFYGDYKGPNYTLSADRSYMVLLGNLIQPSLYPGFGGGWYNIDFADLGGGLLSWTGMAGSFSNPVTASGTGRFALSSSAIQAVPDSGGSLPLLVIALAACVVLPRWVLSRV